MRTADEPSGGHASGLPNFLIVGAAKSGTSFLAAMLGGHPDVFLPSHKESSYFAFAQSPPRFLGPGDEVFNRMVVSDLGRYRALFRDAGRCAAVGEASVIYLARPDSFARMRTVLGPGAKAVALLRNPADRAFSAWSHLVRDGREPLSFRAGLAAEVDRIAAGWENLWAYRGSSRYGESLRTAFGELGRDNVGVWLHEDLEERPLEVLHQICRFLGVDTAGFEPNTEVRINASGVSRSELVNWLVGVRRVKLGWLLPVPALRERVKRRLANANLRPIPFDVGLRAELLAEFRPEIDSLAELLDADLGRWGEPAAGPAAATT